MRRKWRFSLAMCCIPLFVGCGMGPFRTFEERQLTLGDGLEPVVKEMVPGAVTHFTYKQTVFNEHEGSHTVLARYTPETAQDVTIAGMRQWAQAHLNARVVKVTPLGTTRVPTEFLVQYEKE